MRVMTRRELFGRSQSRHNISGHPRRKTDCHIVKIATATVQRADFDLKSFMVSSDLVAIWQLLSVLVPYAALWVAAYHVHGTAPWLLVPIAGLMVLFLSRSFALMHDCGHNSLFRRARVNRAVGFLLGIVNGLPQYPWSRGHAYHHKHNGNQHVEA